MCCWLVVVVARQVERRATEEAVVAREAFKSPKAFQSVET
jgi:hypothetical protein